MTLSRGIHQLSFGAWFQQFQSNETLALSQYGQATFTSLQTFLTGVTTTFLYDPAPTEMNWRSLFGAVYAQDVIRLKPTLTLSLGFRGEFSTGWNEAHGRASTYTFSNGVISSQPHVGNNTFTTNNAKFLPEPRIGVAWSPHLDKTVIRAGFGMYNELQDALGYRTDQNAPFNPDLQHRCFDRLPASHLPAGSGAGKGAAGAGRRSARFEDANSDLLLVESGAGAGLKIHRLTVGYVGSHGYHELIGIDANQPVPTICPDSPCPARYPSTFPGRWQMQPFRQDPITSPPELQRPIPPWRIPGPGFLSVIAATTRSRSTSTIASATIFPFVASTLFQKPWMTGIH